MVATLPPVDLPNPIRQDEAGGYRVGNTKVLLEAFIWAYNHESPTPEDLHRSWPVVEMPLVHAVLAYYHANKAEVDAYVAQASEDLDRWLEEQQRLHPQPDREERIARLREQQRRDPAPWREELLRRVEGQ